MATSRTQRNTVRQLRVKVRVLTFVVCLLILALILSNYPQGVLSSRSFMESAESQIERFSLPGDLSHFSEDGSRLPEARIQLPSNLWQRAASGTDSDGEPGKTRESDPEVDVLSEEPVWSRFAFREDRPGSRDESSDETESAPQKDEPSSGQEKDNQDESAPEKEDESSSVSEKQQDDDSVKPSDIEQLPVTGEIITEYGWGRCETLDEWRFHPGIDIAATTGTPVKAVISGRVVEVVQDPGMGKIITLKLNGGYKLVHAALRSVLVNEGEMVQAGDILGEVGESPPRKAGLTPHLQWEIRTSEGEPLPPPGQKAEQPPT